MVKEQAVVKKIEEMDLDHHGFLLQVDMVRHMTTRILHHWEYFHIECEQGLTLDKHCIIHFFDIDRHAHLALKFSTQVKKQWILSSDLKILKQLFEVLGPLICQFHILPKNLYNMDERGCK